jgi:hypothetical protein
MTVEYERPSWYYTSLPLVTRLIKKTTPQMQKEPRKITEETSGCVDTGTGQQVIQLLDSYMMMMMIWLIGVNYGTYMHMELLSFTVSLFRSPDLNVFLFRP